ncbi:MAG: amino acid-binding protein [Candidatus Bathyarchaeota archaeon]|nr:amino acid-binding protein [Candidatus Bathyarchaeota archaeon]
MWSNVKRYFEGQPERLQIARILIENGLSVKTGRIYVNEIEIPPIRVARAAGVDRRTVKETLNAILANRELRLIFQELRCAGHSLKEVARHIGLGVIEITPSDARTPGILAGAATVLAKNSISIRQAIVDDPELSPEPKLTLITEKKIPGELISDVLKIQGVVKVSLY